MHWRLEVYFPQLMVHMPHVEPHQLPLYRHNWRTNAPAGHCSFLFKEPHNGVVMGFVLCMLCINNLQFAISNASIPSMHSRGVSKASTSASMHPV